MQKIRKWIYALGVLLAMPFIKKKESIHKDSTELEDHAEG